MQKLEKCFAIIKKSCIFVSEIRTKGAAFRENIKKQMIMKTQISKLINGSDNVVRNMADPKYNSCQKGTSADFAGTKTEERRAVAEAVKAENPDALHVSVRGVELTLKAETASSGNLINYHAPITAEQWVAITGHTKALDAYKFETSFEFRINADMTAEALLYARKSEAAMWRTRLYEYIDESFVTIL